MNIAVIFAGGVGKRMKTNEIPKQFLEINGKPIIIETLEKFEKNSYIDAIVISCLESHIDLLKKMIKKYEISKVRKIVHGGKTGQLSIYNGLVAANEISEKKDDIVLINDGVRPYIQFTEDGEDLLKENVENVKKYGTSITCLRQKEGTAISKSKQNIDVVTNRNETYIIKAPQSFYLKDILEAENKAIQLGENDIIDSNDVIRKFGKYKSTHMTFCGSENIKITTPYDFFVANGGVELFLKYKQGKILFDNYYNPIN